MAGKVGCALLLAVLFAAAAVSRTSFAVFLASLAVLLVGFLAWYVRTLRRDCLLYTSLLFSGIGVLLVLAGVGVLFSLKKKSNRA